MGNTLVLVAPALAAYGRKNGTAGTHRWGTRFLALKWTRKRGLILKLGFSARSASTYTRNLHRYGKEIRSRHPAARIAKTKLAFPVAASQKREMRTSGKGSRLGYRSGRKRPKPKSQI